ncbi:MAG: SDR family NAD(P)-dependent oxidoreductase [Actinomycetota bacterium]|nr:SDR family NAD(P)-dependent oxidoreductase [Actinomycetota bacterium]
MSVLSSPFGFESTTDDVLSGVRLDGRHAVVTGATSGLGVETARALAAAGATVTLAVRRPDAGRRVAEELRRQTGNPAIEVGQLDLSDTASIRTFVEQWVGPLHILVNNAGVMAVPELQRTAAGWEAQFAANYLGHFQLTLGLHRALASADGARVVSVSSTGHLWSPIVFDDIHFRFRPYDPWVAYGQSKTACVLLAVEIARRWGSDGIEANALNPGAIATGLQQYTGGLKTPEEFRKTVAQGASTSVLLAASPVVAGVSGHYFENNAQAPVVHERPAELGRGGGVAAYAVDVDNAERLWEIASQWVCA